MTQEEVATASIAEDVLNRDREAVLRRYEAGAWLRKMVGVVVGKDLPAQPSEDDFRLGLRSGIILCKVLNKIKPLAVPKVVEAPGDSILIPDGEALSAYKYFENVGNFLVAVKDMGLPTFETSDLEKGGKSSRIVNCVLALKSYKDSGGSIPPKVVESQKATSSSKQFAKKLTGLFSDSLSKSSPLSRGMSTGCILSEDIPSGDVGLVRSPSLSTIVNELLVGTEQEDIRSILENTLSNVMEEFEHLLAHQKEQVEQEHSLAHQNEKIQQDHLLALQKEQVEQAHPLALEKEQLEQEHPSALQKEQVQQEHPLALQKEQVEQGHPLAIQKEQVEQEHPSALQKEQVEQEHPLALQKEHVEQVITHRKEQQMVNESTSKNEEAKYGEGKSCNSKEDIQKPQLKHKSAMKQQMLVKRHKMNIQELKDVLNAAKSDMDLLKTTYAEEVSNLGKHLRSCLTKATSGYQKVLEENRKLYNIIQDLKGSIRVYLRVRPSFRGDADGVNSVGHLDDESITVIDPSKNGKDKSKSFTFNKVFGPSATQEKVFADTQPLVRSVLDGYNVCIFAYGQTGSGKTHTMSGPDNLTKETMGVNYRALNDLFHISEERKDLSAYSISVQMIEIYNEQVRDLLATDGTNKRLEIRNNTANGINVPDANIVSVSSPSDVINLMNLGHKNRAVGSTAENERSSRSHSCLTVHVEGRDLTSGKVLRGCMHLVDLAGSERLDKTEATGDRLKEAQHINKSLSALGDVIASLAQKNAHVPYRNSKLTQLLQDSLGGQAKTLMFVHISPEPNAIGETISTLKFAERVSSVELGAAKSNRETSELKELKEQNSNLKAALARKDGEMLSPSSSHPSLSDRRQSTDGLSDRRQSMGGLGGHRQSVGGVSDRRQSMGGVSDRRQSIGGVSDHKQSLGGSSHRRQSIGGSSDRRQSMGGVSERIQSTGGSSDRRQSRDGSESVQVTNNPIEILKMHDLDLQEWPAIGSPLKRNDRKDLVPGDWIDKVLINKGDPVSGENSQGRPPKVSTPKAMPNPVKKYPAKPVKSQDTRSGISTTSGRRAANATNSPRSVRSSSEATNSPRSVRSSFDGRRKTNFSK